jgi:hypothetical protein
MFIQQREGRSGEAREKDSRLNLGDLGVCPDDPDYRGGNASGTDDEKSAEAIVAHCIAGEPAYWRAKGRIRFCKEQSGRTR